MVSSRAGRQLVAQRDCDDIARLDSQRWTNGRSIVDGSLAVAHGGPFNTVERLHEIDSQRHVEQSIGGLELNGLLRSEKASGRVLSAVKDHGRVYGHELSGGRT
jgi:hypothetical protein